MQNNHDKIYAELKNCADGQFNMKLAMRLHMKYSKSHANKMKVAKSVLERKKLLTIFINELLIVYRPAIERKIEVREPQNESILVKLQKPVAEKFEDEFTKLIFADLPDNLKILVINRYSAWECSKQKHAEQHSADNDEQRFIAAKYTIGNIIENWKIWTELDHYQKFGEVLGEHQSLIVNEFEMEVIALEKLPVAEYIKEFGLIRRRARNNINRLLKIEKDNSELNEQQRDLLEVWIFKFNYVSIKLKEPEWEKV